MKNDFLFCLVDTGIGQNWDTSLECCGRKCRHWWKIIVINWLAHRWYRKKNIYTWLKIKWRKRITFLNVIWIWINIFKQFFEFSLFLFVDSLQASSFISPNFVQCHTRIYIESIAYSALNCWQKKGNDSWTGTRVWVFSVCFTLLGMAHNARSHTTT